jgi:hypothetical protein
MKISGIFFCLIASILLSSVKAQSLVSGTASHEPNAFNGEKSPKLFAAIDYLDKEIANSPANLFYNANRQNLPPSAKDDFLAMIRNEKKRFSSFPSGVYIKVSKALQDGFIHSPCNKNGSVDLNCVDFSRFLLLRKQHQMSLEIAQEASNANVTYLPLAEHYKNGWFVQKNLKIAYENMKKEGQLRDPTFQDDAIIKMLHTELRQYDSKISVVAKVDEKTCFVFKMLTTSASCESREIGQMLDALSIEKVIANSTPVKATELTGDWISDAPLVVGRTPIKGFDFGKEGIMYASLTNEARNLPSSFAYSLKNNLLEFDVTFSAAGLPVGAKLTFEAWKTKSGALILKNESRYGIYKPSN